MVFYMAFLLLSFSVVLIFLGFRFRRRGINTFGQSYGERTKQRWIKWLLEWDIISDQNQTAHVLPDVVQCSTSIESAAIIGGGIGGVISTFVYILLVIAFPQVALVQDAFAWFHIVPETTFLLLGYIVGYTIGIERQRMAVQRSGVYADLRQRRLSDYRYPLFLMLAVLLIVASIGLTVILTARSGSTFSIQSVLGQVIAIPSLLWVLWILPAGMITTLLICEGAMRQVVALPRLFVTEDLVTAQKVDELLRARTISKFQSMELFYIGMLSLGQWFLLRYESWSIVPVESCGALVLIIGIGLFGLWMDDFSGRIGGKITGWPWRKRILV